eukprot:gene423-366_t
MDDDGVAMETLELTFPNHANWLAEQVTSLWKKLSGIANPGTL